MKEVQKQTTFINQFLALEQCYLLFFFFRNFLFKLYWTYLLYTVKVLLIEFLQHIFFDPSKVTSNPNRRWSLYFSRRIISILNVSFSIVTRSVIGYSCFNNSLYVFLLYSLNIYIMLFKFIINIHWSKRVRYYNSRPSSRRIAISIFITISIRYSNSSEIWSWCTWNPTIWLQMTLPTSYWWRYAYPIGSKTMMSSMISKSTSYTTYCRRNGFSCSDSSKNRSNKSCCCKFATVTVW